MISQHRPDKFDSQFTVVSCLYEAGKELLFLHKIDYDVQGGRWGVPSGKTEPGEEIGVAMLREFREETGKHLRQQDLEHLMKLYVDSTGVQFIYHLYRVTNRRKFAVRLDTSEHQAYRWVTPKQALKLNLIEDMEPCIKLVYGQL